jgi:N-acetylmuramoyl-L-alanine amidase
MTNDRLKRRLLRELVQENVDLIEGVTPWLPRRRGGARVAARVLTLALVPLGLFGSTRLISTFAPPQPTPPSRRPAPAAAGPAAPAVPAVLAPAAAKPALPASLPGRLQETGPIDPAVFPLAVRKVALDPGHGGDSLGTHAPGGLIEKDLTLDIAQRLARILGRRSFDVVMTRAEDRAVSLEERARRANRDGADIFVSIHLNWIENRAARGVETYYLGPTNDPFLTRLAAAENRDSGYSLADLRSLLDRIYADVRQDNSRRLAESVQGSLFHSLGKVNSGLADRGVKAAPFIVLLSTEMPAILAEVSCLSNQEEARQLTKPLYRQYIAEALADGIAGYADAVARSGGKGS